MSRETVYVIEEGEYSDYGVLCAFRTEDDARRAVAAGVGDDYREMVLFGPGEQPRKTVKGWWAHARAGGHWDQVPHVQDDQCWDYDEVVPAPVEVYPDRPEVRETEMADGVLINVRAATREAALKACSDRYARHRARLEGVA